MERRGSRRLLSRYERRIVVWEERKQGETGSSWLVEVVLNYQRVTIATAEMDWRKEVDNVERV